MDVERRRRRRGSPPRATNLRAVAAGAKFQDRGHERTHREEEEEDEEKKKKRKREMAA